MPSYSIDPADVQAEIRALPITAEPLPAPQEAELSPEDQALSLELFYELREGTPRAIRTLKGLIEKYPEVPSLKNHLTAAYIAAGQERRADKVNDKLRRENPDYLFGHLNHASKFLGRRGGGQRIPEILGESLRLRDLKPDVELFHHSEVMGFYNIVAHFHLYGDRPHLALAIYEVLAEIIGVDDPQLAELVAAIRYHNLTAMQKRMAEDDERAIRVIVPPVPEAAPDTSPPEFHHPEMGELYRHGFLMPRATIAEILALPRATLIADLEAVLRDSMARASLFLAEGVDADDEGSYFPLHALFFIGELKAEEALPVVFEVLSQHPDVLEMWFGELLNSNVWEPLYHLIEGRLDAGFVFMCSPGISSRGREALATAVTQVAMHQPERRAEVLEWFRKILDFLLGSSPEDNVLDTELVTGLACLLMDLGAAELLPLISAHHERGHIAETHVGDLADITASMGEPVDEKRRRKLMDVSRRYREIVNPRPPVPRRPQKNRQQRTPADDFNLGQDLVPRAPEVGRNDPCPCGSGKKYKKCCL